MEITDQNKIGNKESIKRKVGGMTKSYFQNQILKE